jgi:hypothetical protein
MFWACARTESKRELVAQHFLGLAGFETYLPRVRERRAFGVGNTLISSRILGADSDLSPETSSKNG